jgi:acyl dehydratase
MHHSLSLEGGFLEFGPRRIRKADILAFASAFDPQPVHLDEAAARETPLRGLAASGWHTCAVIGQALDQVLGKLPDFVGVASIDEVRWTLPVRPDDELLGEVGLGLPLACSCGSDLDLRPAWLEVRNRLGSRVLRWSFQVLFGDRRSSIPAHCALRAARARRVDGRPGEHLIKYFEDVRRGDEIALGSYTFGPESVGVFESIVARGREQAPRAGSHRVQARVQSWNVVAGWMSLIVAYYERRAAELADAGLPVPRLGPAIGVKWLRWLAPVSVGERISFRGWVEHKVNAAGAGEWGLLVAGTEGYNDAGEVVISFYPQFLLERRTARIAREGSLSFA